MYHQVNVLLELREMFFGKEGWATEGTQTMLEVSLDDDDDDRVCSLRVVASWIDDRIVTFTVDVS